MKNFLFLLISIISLNIYGQTEPGIKFQSESFDEAVKLSKRSNKPIFIDFSTKWCGPCKRMESFVFTESVVGKCYNKHFINLKYDAEKGEGILLKKKFEINAYPTLLFLDENQNVIFKRVGYCSPEQLIDIANKVKNDSLEYVTQKTNVQDGEFNIAPIKFNTYLESYSIGSKKDSLLNEYLKKVDKKLWSTKPYWYLIENHLYSITSPIFEYINSNRSQLSSIYGANRINKFISKSISSAFGTPTNLYGNEIKTTDLKEAREMVFDIACKIDSVFAKKEQLSFKISTLTFELRKNPKKTKAWSLIITKTNTYNRKYGKYDKAMYGSGFDRFYWVAANIIPNELNKKAFLKTCFSQICKQNRDEANDLIKYLCMFTVDKYTQIKNHSKNNEKELVLAIEQLSSSTPVNRSWADYILPKVKIDDSKSLELKREIMKKAL